MIGQQISPILEEVEVTLLEFDVNKAVMPNFTPEGFRASTLIFISALMDKMWELQEKEGIPIEERQKMAFKAGQDVRNLIKTYTDIDCHELYKTPTHP